MTMPTEFFREWIIGKVEICKQEGGSLLEYEIRLAPTGALEELQRLVKRELADRDRVAMLVREEAERLEAARAARLATGQPHSDH